MVVIDGSKALAAAVKDAFGNQAFIQRCRVHKKRNVLEHLPEAEQPWVARKWMPPGGRKTPSRP
ncbi:MAG: transposase [Moorella sp. (in: Bacteria)]|nr:transposase [Moorella sp. (in: firmicutes)]